MTILWALAAYGVISKVRAMHDSSWRSAIIYIAMGWIGILAIQPMIAAMPLACLLWILAGGVVYTVGVLFFLWESLPFSHAVWHLFVAGGSACHFVAVLWYVLPMPN